MDENTKKIIMMFKRKTLGVDSVIRQASDLEAKLKATQEDTEELKATVDQCKGENSALKQRLEEKETEIKEIADKRDQERDNRENLEKMRDDLKTEVAELKAKLEQKENEILKTEVAQKDFEKANRQVDELKAELGQKKDEVASLQIELEKSKNRSPEKRKLAETKFEFETKIQELTVNLDKSEDKYNQLKTSYDDKIGENQTMSAEIEKLKQQIAENKTPSKPKNFISFFNKKAILPVKKPQKRVKFFKKGRMDINEYPIGGGPEHHPLPGYIPPALNVVPGDYILPPAFEIEQQQHKKPSKRKPAEDKIKAGPKATPKRSRISHVSESPKKTSLTKKSPTTSKEPDANETTTVPIVKSSPKESKAVIETKKRIAKPIASNPVAKTVIANPMPNNEETLISDQISKPKSIPPTKTKRSLSYEKLSENPPAAIEKSTENRTSAAPSTSSMVKPPPVISTQRQKFRNNFSSEEIIPLGNKLANAPQATERAAKHFVMTPEALKAINARKVTVPKKFAPLAPLPKKPENDPTMRKRSAPSRPAQNKVNTPQPPPPPPLPAKTKNEKAVQNDKMETISVLPPLEEPKPVSKKLKRKRILDSDSDDDDDEDEKTSPGPSNIQVQIVKPATEVQTSHVEKDQAIIDSPKQTQDADKQEAQEISTDQSAIISDHDQEKPNRQSFLEDSDSDVEMEAIRVEENQISVVAQDLDLSDASDVDEENLKSIEMGDCKASQNESDSLELKLSDTTNAGGDCSDASKIMSEEPKQINFESPRASTSNDKSLSAADTKINSTPTEEDKNGGTVQSLENLFEPDDGKFTNSISYFDPDSWKHF